VHGIHRESAASVRAAIERGGARSSPRFREALAKVPASDRDTWIDLVLGLDGELPADEPELPRGCVPYLPCAADALLRVIEEVPIGAGDVFVDVGSGLGRAAMIVHLLTGATVVGIEIQGQLAGMARARAERMRLTGVSYVEGDAAEMAGVLDAGTVFFLYCPFAGERLTKLLAALESLARRRTIHLCCVDLPMPPCGWLAKLPQRAPDLAIHRSLSR
jgi:SAM-dependent methyltransferase